MFTHGRVFIVGDQMVAVAVLGPTKEPPPEAATFFNSLKIGTAGPQRAGPNATPAAPAVPAPNATPAAPGVPAPNAAPPPGVQAPNAAPPPGVQAPNAAPAAAPPPAVPAPPSP